MQEGPTRCPWCNELITPAKWKETAGDISYVIPKGRPKKKVYFHMECYKKNTRGASNAST